MKNDLSQRLLTFTINVIKLLRKLPNSVEYKVVKFQLIKSASSSGANYEEAQGASSKADFNNKIHISLKEARESYFWLNVIHGINENANYFNDIEILLKESEELKKILGSISSKSGKSLEK
jgi:four helix bundle protein